MFIQGWHDFSDFTKKTDHKAVELMDLMGMGQDGSSY